MSGVEPTTIDYQGLKMISEDETQSITFKMEGTSKGIILDYDLTSVPKQFKITPSGINWTDGTSNHTTGLERLALVQTAFQAVELPPNATTLKINSNMLLDNGGTTTNVLSNNQIVISDGVDTTTLTKTDITTANIHYNDATTFTISNPAETLNQGRIQIYSQNGAPNLSTINLEAETQNFYGGIMNFAGSINTSQPINSNNSQIVISDGFATNTLTKNQMNIADNTTFVYNALLTGGDIQYTSNNAGYLQNATLTNLVGQSQSLTFSTQNVPPFSYSSSLQLLNQQSVGGGGGAGIFHNDNNPTPCYGLFQSNQSLYLTTTDTAKQVSLRVDTDDIAVANWTNFNVNRPTTIDVNTTGGIANPTLTINNTDTSAGAGAVRFYKNISSNGSAISEIGSFAKTNEVGNPIKEYSRITSTIRGNTTGNVDGAITFQARINDTLTELMRINGAESNIEIYQNLDLNNKDIISSTGDIDIVSTSSSGTGDINLTSKNDIDITAGTGNVNIIATAGAKAVNITSASNVDIEATGDNLTMTGGSAVLIETTGTGANIEFRPESTAGGLIFTGTALQSNTSSGNSGEHLVITLNGVQYKIKLELV